MSTTRGSGIQGGTFLWALRSWGSEERLCPHCGATKDQFELRTEG